MGIPLALIIGRPLSGLLLEICPLFRLQSWQWMFLVEGFMAVVLGLSAFWYLNNRPSNASWLPAGRNKRWRMHWHMRSRSGAPPDPRSSSPCSAIFESCTSC
jgi:sugar phosphate permease